MIGIDVNIDFRTTLKNLTLSVLYLTFLLLTKNLFYLSIVTVLTIIYIILPEGLVKNILYIIILIMIISTNFLLYLTEFVIVNAAVLIPLWIKTKLK